MQKSRQRQSSPPLEDRNRIVKHVQLKLDNVVRKSFNLKKFTASLSKMNRNNVKRDNQAKKRFHIRTLGPDPDEYRIVYQRVLE